MLKLENSIRGLSFSRVAFDLTIQAIIASIVSYYICKWLDRWVIGQKVCVTNPNKLENL